MDMATATATVSSTMMPSSDTSNMVFNTNNLSAMLYSSSWMPTSIAGYVGTWFFLFFLAIIWRAIVATLFKLDAFWAAQNSQYLILINGGQEKPKQESVVQAWRVSVNLPRAALRTISQGIAYLLMIAVMTMNVGFFFAVLVGYFMGELIFSRLSRSDS
ncbi:Ctr copper transporter [Penicillium lagena]|uniref:Ctr copper transporter n=1 Tax=Penicillium lagena TaxID=94218 RepID=UPI0025425DCF|nr:Ctr copper transporter [Penicillium lagena]KAJ5619345.1 Ctr copper transporter [Penicillium lagena]